MSIQTRVVNSSYTEIYAGGGNFITQLHPTNFHQFYKRKILTSSESIEDFKEVTEAEKTALEDSDAAWTRPPQSFIDEWNTRCVVAAYASKTYGKYNESTGFFELNGLRDITYEQALIIAKHPHVNADVQGAFDLSRARTLFPVNVRNSIYQLCQAMPRLEVIRLVDYFITQNGESVDKHAITVYNTRDAFFISHSLREVQGIIALTSRDEVSQHFYNGLECKNLETIWLKNLSLDFRSAKSCPKLRVECIQYMIENAGNTKAITLTLHPDAYARVTDEIFALAAEKNITIASS